MQVRIGDIQRHLDAQLAPVYLVSGAEPLLIQEVADAIRAAAAKRGFGERQRLVVETGFDWDELAGAADSLSLFSALRLIELRMESAKPGDKGAKALAAHAAKCPPDAVLLVICGALDASARRSRWVKALDQAGVWIHVWPVDLPQLPNWIRSRMRRAGLEPDSDAVSMVSERVEGNLLAAAQEVEKLALALGPGEIDAEAVLVAVADTARYDPFTLADAALSGHAARVVRIVQGLRDEGTEPVLLAWALAREVRAAAAMAGDLERGQSLSATLARHRVWEKRKALFGAALKRHRRQQWLQLLAHCARLDQVIKGARSGQLWDELLQLSLLIAGCDPLNQMSAEP